MVGAVLLVGCVSVQVEPLVLDAYPPRADGRPPASLDAEPVQPHLKLARVIALSEYTDEDGLRDTILSRAKILGADAVVFGRADVLESTGLGQTYQSTNARGVSSSLFGGMGGGMPFFFDPWTYVQAPTDRVEYTLYLSGVAIRYPDAVSAGRDGADPGERPGPRKGPS